MHSVNLTIKKNYIKKDGTTPIYLQYNFSRENRTLIKTGKFIEPIYWNSNTKQVRRNHPDYNHLTLYLKSMKTKLEHILDESILNGKTPTITYVEEQFKLKTSPESKQSFTVFDRLDEYINSKKGHVVDDVITDYLALKKHLTFFEKHRKRKIVFSDINSKFYNDFVYYLSYYAVKPNKEVGLRKSTVGKTIKNLKAFLNYCTKNNIIASIDLSSFKTLTNKAYDIYISDEEIEKLLNLDLSDNPKHEQLRDLFVIGCETGLRYSDFSRLTKQHINIKDRIIKITMKKTTDTVVIPISNRLLIILEKYNYNPPSNIPSHYFNKEIKVIGLKAQINEPVIKIKEVGNLKIEEKFLKYQCISSHTCRRSFCTNQFLKGMPSLLIRKISGHTDEKSFLQYIKVDEELAAQKMLEMWFNIENEKTNKNAEMIVC